MEDIVIGIKVKKTNIRAKTTSAGDGALRLDAEKIAVDFFNGQYKYHFSQGQGLLDGGSPIDVEMTIRLNGNRFVESHAFDIKDQIERELKKKANVRIIDKTGNVTVV